MCSCACLKAGGPTFRLQDPCRHPSSSARKAPKFAKSLLGKLGEIQGPKGDPKPDNGG
jgi:hypothetical protein